MTKDWVKDKECRMFDTYVKIKQCWEHLARLFDEGRAIPFTKRPNKFNADDVYISVPQENGVYIVSLGSDGEIVKIVRF